LVEIVSVTKKGQATIPKRLRDKYGIKGKALIEESEEGILLKPLPSPKDDFGSLKSILGENLKRTTSGGSKRRV